MSLLALHLGLFPLLALQDLWGDQPDDCADVLWVWVWVG
jgi:hypothetical protein